MRDEDGSQAKAGPRSGVWRLGDAFSRDSEVQRLVFWFRRGLPEDEIPLQCGFPVIRFVALLSLNRGAILKVMMDGLRSRYWKGRPCHYRDLN